jgi:hypothetical protein
MECPHCQSVHTNDRPERTELGYRRFRCRRCHREFNERTDTPFNRLQYPSDVVCLVVVWRLRYKLSLRDLAEMFLERGFVFTHEVRNFLRFQAVGQRSTLLAWQRRMRHHHLPCCGKCCWLRNLFHYPPSHPRSFLLG